VWSLQSCSLTLHFEIYTITHQTTNLHDHTPNNKCSRYMNTQEREALCVSFPWAAWPCWLRHYNFSIHPVTAYPTPKHTTPHHHITTCQTRISSNAIVRTSNLAHKMLRLLPSGLWYCVIWSTCMHWTEVPCSDWWWDIGKWQYAHTRLCDVMSQRGVLVITIHKSRIS
jgi:hypothetical protein